MRKTHFLLAVLFVGISKAAIADTIIDWNNIALDTIKATSEKPPVAARALAMMHIAMYDAVNGIDKGSYQYAAQSAAPSDALAEISSAVAAYNVLRDLYPSRDSIYAAQLNTYLSSFADGSVKVNSIQWGEYCASAILQNRLNDGANAVVPYTPSGNVGTWRPTPPANAPALLPQWGYVKPFAMATSDQFRPVPPPALTSTEYATAYNEVKELGSLNSATRTADQTEIAKYWADGAGSVTPPGHWQVIAQGLANQFSNTLVDNAKMFALLSIAQADAAICAWDAKYFYEFMRPYTAITIDADLDNNPDTLLDASWQSLLTTPPFPGYTSGHSTFSGASAIILANFFGTDLISFSLVSQDPALPGVIRSWNSLSEAAEEAGISRIYGGIHFQFDNTEGLDSGRQIGNYVYNNFLQTVPEPATMVCLGLALFGYIARSRKKR